MRVWGTLLRAGCALVMAAWVLAGAAPARAVVLPPGFHEVPVVTGLNQPTAVRFAPDGAVFIAEKRGIILAQHTPGEGTPVQVADLRTETLNWWDRGLLGLAVDPGYPGNPYIYALYTRNALPGGDAPQWGAKNDPEGDDCSSVDIDHCIASARLVRITVDPATLKATAGGMKTLITDWCQQDPSHSIGDLQFGPDGMLYAGAGDAASYEFVDYGQNGNPCGDPPGAVGTALAPPSAEGGALRAQDLRTTGDPTTLDGAIIRVDPSTGLAAPGNPLSGPDDNARRIVAYGLRNPFRFSFRPGTSELYIGDVGWNTNEELETLHVPGAAPADFGWPCYEGTAEEVDYKALGLSICDALYGDPGAVRAPAFTYRHDAPLGLCDPGSSAISGIAFGGSPEYPQPWRDGVYFEDYARGCIWHMDLSGGEPDPSTLETFAQYAPGEGSPVDLQSGPGGDLYIADIASGTIWTIQHNDNPTARATADVTESLSAPLTVNFDASASRGGDGSTNGLTYAWDLNGDGVYDDATGPTATHEYKLAGTYGVRVKVTDTAGRSSVSDLITITPGNTKPAISAITVTPAGAVNGWSVGDQIAFSASATDTQDGPLPPSQMNWRVLIRHCPSDCHTHYLTAFSGVDGDHFTAPDHEYPSHLELDVTATDSSGLSATKTIDLNPKTVKLTLLTDPTGRDVTLNGHSGPSPLTASVIRGSSNSVGVASPQQTTESIFTFDRWSDALARTHQLTLTADRTLTATFGVTAAPRPPVAPEPSLPDPAPAPASPAPAGVKTAGVTQRFVVKRHGVRADGAGTVTLRVRCPGTTACRGSLLLESGGRRLSTATVVIAADRARLVRLRLTQAARVLLARRRQLTARSVLEVRAGSRTERLTTQFVLRAARRR